MHKWKMKKAIPENIDLILGDYHQLIRKLLFYRGIDTKEKAEDFLNPNYEKYNHNPFLLKDAEKSADRIIKAIENNEKIAIYSDYDHDGIPGGVILHDFFKKIGYKNFVNYIPHRHDEGFGLNPSAVGELAEGEVKLIITIDCGIADIDAVDSANELGIDVIITDHHLISEKGLPKAYAIVNPKQTDCNYPEKMLCGAGVVYKLIQAINFKLTCPSVAYSQRRKTSNLKLATIFPVPEGQEKWWLDMVGIATISDMVPLTGENRTLAYYGLKVLRKTPRIGLLKLFAKLKIDKKNLNEDDIGFSISPRINAASRMDSPEDAFNLLATDNEIEAEKYANHLDNINNERKGKVASIVKEVHRIVAERNIHEERKIIVLGNPDWKPALLGLVANSVAERYKKPVFLWGREGNNCLKGSCRSGGNINLLSIMKEVSVETIEQFGGHALAGGFSIKQEKIHFLFDELESAFIKASKEMSDFILDDENIDAVLDPEEVNLDLYNQIEKLAPFGVGNPKPVFLFEKVKIENIEQFGKEKNHLKILIKRKSSNLSAIAFFKKAEDFAPTVLKKGSEVNIVGTLEKSYFMNRVELRIRIVDIY